MPEPYRPNFSELVQVRVLNEDLYYGVVCQVSRDVTTVFISNGLIGELKADEIVRVPMLPGVESTANFAEVMRSSHQAIEVPRLGLELDT